MFDIAKNIHKAKNNKRIMWFVLINKRIMWFFLIKTKKGAENG